MSAAVSTSTGPLLVAMLAWVVLIGGAGCLLGWRVLRSHDWLERMALIPAFGAASLFGYRQLTDLFDLTVGAATLGIWLVLTALAGLRLSPEAEPIGEAVAQRPGPEGAKSGSNAKDLRPGMTAACTYPRRFFGRRAHDTSDTRVNRRLLLAVGATVLLAAIVWLTGLHGPDLAPTHIDTGRHAFFVARISVTGSNDAAQVLLNEVRAGEQSASYYPLTMHSAASVLHDSVGLSIPSLLAGWSVVWSTFALVPGAVLLARRLTGDDTVAAVAGLVTALAFPFPFEPLMWGGLPMIASLSVVAAASGAAADWAGGRRSLVVAALAVVGCVGLHNAQAMVVVALTAVLTLAGPPRTIGLPRRVLQLGVTCALLAGPDIVAFASGISERTRSNVLPTVGIRNYLDGLATFGSASILAPATITATATLGMVMIWRSHSRSFVVVIATIVALAALAAVNQGPITRTLTLPWYSFPTRLNSTAFVLLGSAVALPVVAALRRVPRPTIVGPVIGIAALVPLASIWLPRVQTTSLVGAEQIAAFEYLASVSDPGEAVLNESLDDGSIWMYTIGGATPLFAFPIEFHEPGPQGLRNLALLDLVADPDSAPADVQRLAAERCVTHVYSTEDPFVRFPQLMSRPLLRASPFLAEVFTAGDVSVFEINGTRDLTCSAPSA